MLALEQAAKFMANFRSTLVWRFVLIQRTRQARNETDAGGCGL